MDAKPVQIMQYFDGEKQNMIPLFQRPYTWEKKDWQALWSDILAQYESDSDQNHFLGAIVSMPARTVPVGVNKHLIIDGQQRLTTIALLLCALRKAIRAKVNHRTNLGRIGDLLKNPYQVDPDDLKFFPTEQNGDQICFRRLVEEKDPLNADHRMVKAVDFFAEKLTGNDEAGNPLDPDHVFDVLRARLCVVMISLSDTDDPYLIFESLNFKGQDLAPDDLVRNYVLMRFRSSVHPGGTQRRIYDEIWHPFEQRLQGEARTEFLRHYAMKGGAHVKERAVYAAIKKRFEGLSNEDAVEAELRDLSRHSEYYDRFLRPKKEPDSEIRRCLQGLLDLDSTTSFPLLLRLRDEHHHGRCITADWLSCLRVIESFIVRRLLCEVPTNALNKLFLQMAKETPTSDHLAWLRSTLARDSGSRRFPSDDEVRTSLINRPLYGRDICRFLLVRLEESFAHKEPVDLSKATIEHVMPQKLTPVWRSALGPDDSQIHERWLHCIGNLTLSAYNSELGNIPFKDKKDILKISHIELNKWICEQDEWRAAEMSTRGKDLAEKTIAIFPRP